MKKGRQERLGLGWDVRHRFQTLQRSLQKEIGREMQGVKQWTVSTARGATGQLLPQRTTKTAGHKAANQQLLVEPETSLTVSWNSQPKSPIDPQLGVSRRHFLAFTCSCCVGLHLQQRQAAASDSGGTFSYEGSTGPSSWPGACQTGAQQSPINLTLSQAVECDSRTPPTFRCVVKTVTWPIIQKVTWSATRGVQCDSAVPKPHTFPHCVLWSCPQVPTQHQCTGEKHRHHPASQSSSWQQHCNLG